MVTGKGCRRGAWTGRLRGRRAGGERGASLQVLRGQRRCARRQLRGAEGRGVRAARAERCGQDDHGRDPRGLSGAQRRAGPDARCRSRRPQHAAMAAHAHRRRAAGAGGRALLLGAPGAQPQRGLLPQPAAGRRGDRADRAGGEGRRPRQAAVGWPAAEARRGPRDHRQPGPPVPRRAHDRSRPLGPARHLGAHPASGRRGHHGAADDALHGRGGGAGRPGGGPVRPGGRGQRHAVVHRWPRPRGGDDPLPPARGGVAGVAPGPGGAVGRRPRRDPHRGRGPGPARADGVGARGRPPAAGAVGPARLAGGRLPRAHPGAGHAARSRAPSRRVRCDERAPTRRSRDRSGASATSRWWRARWGSSSSPSGSIPSVR